MSFSLDVKDDLLKRANPDKKSDLTEIEAMLRFSSEVIISRPMRLELTCASMNIIRRFVSICKKYYDIDYEIQSRVINRFNGNSVFTLNIIKNADLLIKDFNLLLDKKEEDLEETEKIAYLRGSFLTRGTVNDPNSKNSHLEISTTNESEILYVQKLINSFGLNARITKRKNYLVTYIKSKEAIGDFLYLLGATASMSYYEDIIITKEIKATAKREINLDVANQDKTNKASKEQLEIIEYITYNYPLDNLDSKLLMVMKVRKDYPEHSLTQLLDVIHEEYEPNLSKSGLNHRFRKLKELYDSLKEIKNN